MNMPEPFVLERSARWQRAADSAARWAWLVLLVAVTVALAGGVATATWDLGTDAPAPEAEECESPPCFGGGGLPSASSLPAALPLLGYGLAVVLGLPSLLAAGWDLLRGRWAAGSRRLLVFGGPVLVLVGIEVVPHLASPCLPAALGVGAPPGLCEQTEQGGLDVGGRWHALDHALVGALPMVALYWLALRRWRPDITRRRMP